MKLSLKRYSIYAMAREKFQILFVKDILHINCLKVVKEPKRIVDKSRTVSMINLKVHITGICCV